MTDRHDSTFTLAIFGLVAAVALIAATSIFPFLPLPDRTGIAIVHTILVLATIPAFVAFDRATRFDQHYIWTAWVPALAAIASTTLMPILSRNAYELEVLCYYVPAWLASRIFIVLFALLTAHALNRKESPPTGLVAFVSLALVVGMVVPTVSLGILAAAFAAQALQSLRQPEAVAGEPTTQS